MSESFTVIESEAKQSSPGPDAAASGKSELFGPGRGDDKPTHHGEIGLLRYARNGG